ncbi:unnamed protein product [[Candida] boidinii]|nr:unnamed protein product [[Candida] boidinii]
MNQQESDQRGQQIQQPQLQQQLQQHQQYQQQQYQQQQHQQQQQQFEASSFSSHAAPGSSFTSTTPIITNSKFPTYNSPSANPPAVFPNNGNSFTETRSNVSR